MSLTPGTRLGSYEILNAIGAGGMGEVYRARDTTLNRDVALKILPEAFATDPERLGRFRREAQVLASLNHPNIATIHEMTSGVFSAKAGSEKTPDVISHALVMELVEGQDLSVLIGDHRHSAPAARPKRGAERAEAERMGVGPHSQLSLEDALAIARQIALALEAAHDAGIIHRDLKPANIKVKADGSVKVLDFGLAKAMDTHGSSAGSKDPASEAPSNRPTMTSPATTGLGVILGTASYMSPEQARGRAVDKRGDMWAFGVVLLEMLTGRPVFAGDTITDVIAAVVTREPDWKSLPATTPPAVRRLLRRCLEKDPARRLRDAADARLEIEEALSAPPAEAVAHVSEGRRANRLLWPVATAVAFVLGAAAVWIAAPRGVEPTELRRFSIARPKPMAAIRISPDGQWLVSEDTSLKIRRLSEAVWRDLPGTEGAYIGSFGGGGVFWSPDSRYMGFQMGESLKKIDVHGSPPVSICDRCITPEALRGASWNADGVILVSAGRPGGQQIGLSGIWRIPQNGGEIQEVTSLDTARADNSHRFPFFLPDGRRFLFTARRSSGEHAIMLGSLDGTPPEQVALGYSTLAYASGYLLFVRNGSLIATPFDPSSGKPTGDPQTVAEGVQYHPGVGGAQFSVTNDGTLVINEEAGKRGIGFVERLGRPIGLLATGNYDGAGRLSRDETRVVVGFTDPGGPGSADIYVIDIASGQRSQLTSDPRWDQTPAWHPDGKSVMFRAPVEKLHTLFVRPAEGSESERRLLTATDGGDLIVNDWAPDGTVVLIEKRVPRASRDLMLLPMPAADRLEPWLATTANESDANISPDGRWVTYVSDQSGAPEVYVRAFRDGGAGLRVTTSGGRYPIWSKDGKELFFLDGDGMMAVRTVHIAAASVTLGATTVLFDAAPLAQGDETFDVDRRGRFLMHYVEPETAAWRAEILFNWPKALRK